MPAEVLWAGRDDGDASLEADAERLLEAVELADAELAVTLCDDEHIRELNEQWRGKDSATDVLSFPGGEMPPGAPRALGDVVISVPTAARQAEELGHSVGVELRVLLVHGLLHVLGHDHDDVDDREAMQSEEARLLEQLGLSAAGLVGRALDG